MEAVTEEQREEEESEDGDERKKEGRRGRNGRRKRKEIERRSKERWEERSEREGQVLGKGRFEELALFNKRFTTGEGDFGNNFSLSFPDPPSRFCTPSQPPIWPFQ